MGYTLYRRADGIYLYIYIYMSQKVAICSLWTVYPWFSYRIACRMTDQISRKKSNLVLAINPVDRIASLAQRSDIRQI